MLLIITSTGNRFLNLLTLMTLNDLKPPPKKKSFSKFLQFLDAAHNSTLNCDEMAGDIPRQPAMKFSALNVDVRADQVPIP